MVDYYWVHEDVQLPEVKVILWSLSKLTQNETGFQVSDAGSFVYWKWEEKAGLRAKVRTLTKQVLQIWFTMV